MIFTLYLVFFFVCGAVIGSFTNCFIWRLYCDESLMGRSYCPKCRNKISWYDNIPVISFLFLRAKCRKCRQSISWQYPAVEISTALLFAAVFLSLTSGFDAQDFYRASMDPHFIIRMARDLFIVFIFTVVFVYDLRWYLVSDKAVLPASALLLVMNLYLGASWLALLLSIVLGGGFFLIQFLISKGKWMGGGDIRLGVLIACAFARLDYLAMVLMLAYCLGSVISLGLVALGKKSWASEVPLGVFLAMASLISLLFGERILFWFTSIY